MRSIRSSLIFGILLFSAVPSFSSDYRIACDQSLAAGDYNRAEEIGRTWVSDAERNAEAHFCLADALRLKNDLHRANQQMKTAELFASNNEYLALRLALREISQETYHQQQKELQLKISNGLGDISYKLQDYAPAIIAYQRSISFARELGNKELEATAYSSLADVQSNFGQYDSALLSYRSALTITSLNTFRSGVYSDMGVVYGKIGNFSAAEDFLSKSLAIDEQSGDRRSLARHLLNLGLIRQSNKDYAGAATAFSRSRQVSRGVNDQRLEAAADWSLGELYRLLGNVRLAKTAYTSALEHFTASNSTSDVEKVQKMLDVIGKLLPSNLETGSLAACNEHLAAGEYAKAVDSGRMAVDAAKRSVDAHFCLSEAWRMKGDLRRAQQQMQVTYTLASEYDYLASLKAASQENSPEQHQRLQKELLLKISSRLGNIAAQLRDYDQAFVEYQRSITLSKELANKDQEATAYANLARLFSDQGEYESSLEQFREALKLTSRESEISSLYNNMAVVYGHMGNFPVAEEYFAKSLTLDEKLGDKRAQAMHLLNLGLNHQAKKNYTAAADFYSKSRRISLEQKDYYWAGAADRHFGDMYRALGNMRLSRLSYSSARGHFVTAHAIADSDSIANVIDDLDEAQPVAGIEIDSKGVNTLLFALRTDKKGGVDFKEVLNMSSGSVSLHSKDDEALSTEEIESLAAGVTTASKQLLEERNLNRSVLTVMMTGIPARSKNRDALTNRVKQITGIAPVFMTADEKTRYGFIGSVAPGKEAGGILINVTADTTSLTALNSTNAVVTASLPQGAFTAVRQQGKKSGKGTVRQSITGPQSASLRQEIQKIPELLSRKSVYLEGDVPRIVAILTSPDKDGNLVKITIADLDKFIKAIQKKHSPYFNPNLNNIKAEGVQLWAEGELAWLKQNFVPDDLMAGVLYLKMLMTELKVKEAYVSRGGSWLAGRLYETARMAEKLESDNK